MDWDLAKKVVKELFLIGVLSVAAIASSTVIQHALLKPTEVE